MYGTIKQQSNITSSSYPTPLSFFIINTKNYYQLQLFLTLVHENHRDHFHFYCMSGRKSLLATGKKGGIYFLQISISWKVNDQIQQRIAFLISYWEAHLCRYMYYSFWSIDYNIFTHTTFFWIWWNQLFGSHICYDCIGQ